MSAAMSGAASASGGAAGAKRRPVVAGNWKMYKDRAGAGALARAIADGLGEAGLRPGTGAHVDTLEPEVVLCPPFTALETVAAALGGRPWPALGAQNAHWEKEGAFTGEIAPEMLADVGCRYAILGHSERRQYFGETDEGVSKRLAGALRTGLVPIVCVGETLAQREAGQTGEVVTRQLNGSLATLPADKAAGAIIAYEPVWAIGTGKAASSADAQEVAALIRRVFASKFGPAAGAGMRLLYGGSVKPENARDYFRQPDVDGALVGGASLVAASFLAIIAAAREA